MSRKRAATAKARLKAKGSPPAKSRSKAGGKTKAGGAWAAIFAPRAPGEKRYWLVKSEPEVFSFDDLLRIHNKTTRWDGVRNFAARNFLKDGMKLGDRVFFYHSMSNEPGIVGICEVVRESYADPTAFDSTSYGFDPKSNPERPTWVAVDLRAVAQLTHPVTLAQIKRRKELKGMALLRIGRLSVTPVAADEWRVITEMAAAN